MITMSRLPRLAVCPGSAALPVAATQSQWADLGHARHAILDTAIKGGDLDQLPSEIRALIPPGALVKAEVAVAYNHVTDTARLLGENIEREYELEDGEVAGTIDLLIIADGRVTLVDWKGFDLVDAPDRNHQLLGYALAAARLFKVAELRLVVAYVEEVDGEIRLLRAPVVRDLDELDLDAFGVALRGIVARVEEQKKRRIPDVVESRHCRWCDHLAHCPAKRELLVRLANGGEARELEAMLPLTPKTAAIAYENLKHAENLLKRVRAAVYAYAAEVDIPLPNGAVLGKRIKEGNEKLDGDITATVLAEMYGQEVADAATLKREAAKTRIEAALKSAGVKPLSKAKEAVLEEIRKRGGSKHEDKETIDEHLPELPAARKAG